MRHSSPSPSGTTRPNFFARLRAAPLPEPVYREFVDFLFGMRVPVVGMGLVFTCVSALLAHQWHDNLITLLALLGIVITLGRYLLMTNYHRSEIEGSTGLARWERAYGIANYLFAALLGLLNVRLIGHDEPLAQLIGVSLVFSFCAGVVARISVRPIICAISVLLATAPTIGGLAWRALATNDSAFHAQLFMIEAILMAMITALSLQTMTYLYRSAVQHHTSRHDLGRMAKHDALTGLANRLRLREEFRGKSQRSFNEGAHLALQFIDLDGFKAINDTFGHPAGDVVLQQVANRLTAMVRDTDIVARLGGDEFVIVQAQVVDPSEAELLGRRIIKRISEPYEYDEQELRISASIGIAMLPECGIELEMLLSAADAALYRSKSNGKHTVTFAKALDGSATFGSSAAWDAASLTQRAV